MLLIFCYSWNRKLKNLDIYLKSDSIHNYYVNEKMLQSLHMLQRLL